MTLKNPANSVKPKLHKHGNAELGTINAVPSVETLHGTSLVDEDKVRLSSKDESDFGLTYSSRPSSLGQTVAALTQWRCINFPNSGNPKLRKTTDITPLIGETRRASELGYALSAYHNPLYTFALCKQCSRARWVRSQDLKTHKGELCRSCSHTTTNSFRNHVERVVESGAKRASELGKHLTGKRDPWYYPHQCSVCGKAIWHQRKDLGRVCKNCGYTVRKTARGSEHHNWHGGRYVGQDGYVVIQLQPDDPLYAMANARGCVLEHRLVMARSVGRCLSESEVVHHINGNKLEKMNKLQVDAQKRDLRIRLLEWRVRELEQGNPELAGELNRRASVETLQEALPVQDTGR